MARSDMTTCRTCLGPLDLPVNLINSGNKNLLEVLQRLLAFQVHEQGQEFNVCDHCRGKLIWISDFQIVCLKSIDNIGCIKGSPGRLYNGDDDLSQQIKLDVSLERCHRIEELIATEYTDKEAFYDEEVPTYLQDRLHSPSGDDSDYQPSDDSKKRVYKRKTPDEKSIGNNEDRISNGRNIRCSRSRCVQFPLADILQALKEIHSYRTDIKNRQCIFCDFIGRNAVVLRRHAHTSHKDIKNWCEHCNIQSDDLQEHREAVQCHRWQCKFCKVKYASIRSLTTHLQWHCSARISNVSLKLQQYPKSVVLQAIADALISKDVEGRSCVLCAYVSNEAGYLKIHMNGAHKMVYGKWCMYCNMITQNLKEHAKCSEEACKFCGGTFKSAKCLKTHLQQHCRRELCPQVQCERKKVTTSENKNVFDEMEDDPLLLNKANTVITTSDIENSGTNSEALKNHISDNNIYEVDDCNLHVNRNLNSSNSICAESFNESQVSIPIGELELNPHAKEQYNSLLDDDNDDSDSDYNNMVVKERRRQVLSIACQQEDKPSRKRFKHKQYEFKKVFEAIEEVNSRSTDLKYRQCILCDFIGEKSTVLQAHVRKKHKTFRNWCRFCNLQTVNLDQHKDTLRCHVPQCNLCQGVYSSKKELFKHLRSHCHKFKTALKKACVMGVRVTYRQYPVDQVLRAIADCRSKITDIKRIGCLHCDYRSCLTGPMGWSKLSIHMRTTHKSNMSTWCKRCNVQTENLQRHLDTVKCSEKRCVFCKKDLGKSNKLITHLKLHCFTKMAKKTISLEDVNSKIADDNKTGDAPNYNLNDETSKKLKTSRVCLICQKAFRNVQLHMIQKHNLPSSKVILEKRREMRKEKRNEKIMERREKIKTVKKHLCAYCGKTYKSSTALIYHNAKIHNEKQSGQYEFKCSLCVKTFRTAGGLNLHVTLHKKIDPIICDVCGKSALSKYVHKKHMEEHMHGSKTTVLPLQCPNCDKQYYGRKSFKLHLKQHAGTNQYHCIPCGKSFAYKCLLQCHLKIHDNLQPYECNICGKRFKTDENRKKHEIIHTGKKRYKCTFCSFKSMKSHCLTNHMKQHPEDVPQASRPHKCELCFRSFSTNAVLISHIDYCHSDSSKKSINNPI